MVTVTKRGLDALKTASRKAVHKAAEATGEIIGSNVADKIVKPNLFLMRIQKNFKEIVIPPEKREEIMSELRKVL